jgi:hypothetical protein
VEYASDKIMRVEFVRRKDLNGGGLNSQHEAGRIGMQQENREQVILLPSVLHAEYQALSGGGRLVKRSGAAGELT